MATQLAGKDSYQLPADEASGSKLSIVGEDDLLTLPAVTTQLNNETIQAAEDRDSDDTDIELEVESGRKSAKFDTSGKNAYLGACRMFNQVPVSYFLRNGDNEVMRLRHHSVGPLGVKAICVALISNTTIEVLDLHDNGVEDQGCQYMAEMLKENYFITELILSNNNIGPKGAAALFDSVKQSDSLIKLDLSGNKLGDRSAKDINEAMTENTRISHLNLGNNGFGEKAGEEFGKMLFNNYTLLHLDVSSNNFRTTGVQLFFQGLKKNISLVSLNFANNGIGVEGCADVCKALKENKTLEEVNISNNRIPLAGTVLLAKAFKVNVNLQCLDVSRNPFQAAGCMVLTEALMKTPHTALRYISFNHILVTRQVCELQQTLEMEKFILFSHGGINEGWKTKASKVEPKTTREVLCFLTAEECQQLGTELQAVDEQGRGKVTQQTFRKVMMDIGWNLRCAEITRRLVDKVKDLGYIEYSSLLPPSDQVSKTSSKESGYTMVN